MRQRSATLSAAADQPAQAAAAVREVCGRVAAEALPATGFLPPDKRLAARAVVGFFGMIREAIWAVGAQGRGSGCGSDGNLLESSYALLLDRIDELYAPGEAPVSGGESRHILNAVTRAVARYQIPKECFLSFAQGVREDAITQRYATWSALMAHCQRTGGSVVLALSAVLGLAHSDAAGHMRQLGVAIRLTRILGSVRRDVAGGRLYLPLEDLARFKVSQKELSANAASDRFRELMRFEVSRAWELFHEGCQAICWIAGDGSRLAASLAAAQGAWALHSIERRGYDVLGSSVVPPCRKLNLRLVAAAWRLARRKPGKPLPNLFGGHLRKTAGPR